MLWNGISKTRARIAGKRRLGVVCLAPPPRPFLMRSIQSVPASHQKDSFPICSSFVWADARAFLGLTAPVHAVFSALASTVDTWSQRGNPTRVVIAFSFQTWLVRLAMPSELLPNLLATAGAVMVEDLVGNTW